MPDSRPTKFNAVRSPASTARAGPEIVSTCRPAATVPPSRKCAWILISGESFRNVATASGRPAITPACRATRMAWAWVTSGMVAIEVMSPARPRSSSSARCTASSMASGDRNASGFSSEAGVVMKRVPIGGWCFSVSLDLRLHALKRDHHVQVACGFLAQRKQRLILGGVIPGIEKAHIRELDDDNPFRLPMTAFGHFVASAFGQIASAVPGNHRANLDAIFLELCGIGDDVFGDIVGWHRLLRYGTCNGPR